ncbi:MAG: cytochrome c family protein [Alphaproteobacteria bacterium]|nr:cytochrome c family protein [Alphaproteobacteria bacterium]MDD9920459.1 cytochrome c family protein [Alphaproteobacteria bacterium]
MASTPIKIFITAVIVADLAAIVYFGGRWIAEGSLLPEHTAHEEHIVVASVKDQAAHGEGNAVEKVKEVFDLATYIPDIKKGAKIAGKCKACHTFDQGGKHRTGPNLWASYGDATAGKEGFAYSPAMAGMNGTWDDDTLHAFLENPRGYVSGTKMQFNGIKKPKDRADLIAWLKTLQ